MIVDAYYGYDKVGLATTFAVNRSNVRRYFAANSSVDMRHNEASSAPGTRSQPMAVTFTRIGDDAALLAQAQAMQRTSPAYCERGDDFALLCGGGLQAAFDDEGNMVGYLLGSGGSINEMEAVSTEAAVGMVRSCSLSPHLFRFFLTLPRISHLPLQVTSFVMENGSGSGRVHGDDDVSTQASAVACDS